MQLKYTTISFFILILFFSFLSPTFAGSILFSWNPNPEDDLKSYRIYLGKASRDYGPAVDVGNVTDYLLDGLEDDTVYFVTLTAVDNAGNESGFTTEIEIKTGTEQNSTTIADTSSPIVNITAPTTSDSYDSDQAELSIAGEAYDDSGIAAITWESDNGTSGQAAGTTTWSASGIALSEGSNTITIHAYDDAGNEAIDQLQVTYNPTSPNIITLSANTYKVKGDKFAKLTWSGAESERIDIYRDGGLIPDAAGIPNDGAYLHGPFNSGKPKTYQLCEAGASTCSNEITVSW
jgi:hypothetical protein